jgi:dihydroorotate dehydrogenase (fumarate)
MAIETKYMGFSLRSPLIVASSGLTDSLQKIKKIEECGGGAVVLKSLFEEQIISDSGLMSLYHLQADYSKSSEFAEEITNSQVLDNYIDLIYEAKQEVSIPVFASINCISSDIWPQFAMKLEEAGVDGIELNVSISPSESSLSADQLTARYLEIVGKVLSSVSLPVSIKISPFFTNLSSSIIQISQTGVNAVVLFNRLYTPDIDIENINVSGADFMSSPVEILTPLRWIALMSPKIKCRISGSTGVHDYSGAIKMLLAGASTVQVCSVLYKNGVEYLQEMNNGIEKWMNAKNFSSIEEFRGLIAKNLEYTADFERIQYMKRTFL